jgi:hypothetical protein
MKTFSVLTDEYVRALRVRFWVKVDKSDNCWIFTGAGDGHGYGKLGIQLLGKQRYPKAHVVSYLLEVGDIPADLDVGHRCNVKRCVNPEHLYVCTRSENTQHAIRDGLQWSRLTDEQIRNMRQAYRDTPILQSELAMQFGVDQQIVSRIVNYKSFRWVN